jgi:rfaE bifunctional protein kinase chain/domain
LHSTRQQVIRLDYDGSELNSGFHDPLLKSIAEEVPNADAVIVSDYNYGVVSPEVAKAVREDAASEKIPVLVDSRYRLSEFEGFTSATPNEDEVEQLLGKQFDSATALEFEGEAMRERLGYRSLLITRGSHGMVLFEDAAKPFHIDAVGPREPVDVTGAGDTVIATYTLALASGASFPDAARLANYAGGIVVMKRGTASVTGNELQNSILNTDYA